MRQFSISLSVAIMLLLGCSGYEVEDLSSTANRNAQELTAGSSFSFMNLLSTACADAVVVGAYSSDQERDSLVGRASVSMEGQGQFVLVAAFDEAGQRVKAVRIERTPVDFDVLAGLRVPCAAEIAVIEEAGSTIPDLEQVMAIAR